MELDKFKLLLKEATQEQCNICWNEIMGNESVKTFILASLFNQFICELNKHKNINSIDKIIKSINKCIIKQIQQNQQIKRSQNLDIVKNCMCVYA